MEEKRADELAEIGKELENTIASAEEHHCDDPDCDHTSSRGESEHQPYKRSIAEMEEQQQPTITMKEMKALKHAGYDKIADKYQFAYVLQNKKTGLVVEIRAASSVHACNIIGWRPKNVKLLEVIDTKKKENAEKEADAITSEVFTNTDVAKVE